MLLFLLPPDQRDDEKKRTSWVEQRKQAAETVNICMMCMGKIDVEKFENSENHAHHMLQGYVQIEIFDTSKNHTRES